MAHHSGRIEGVVEEAVERQKDPIAAREAQVAERRLELQRQGLSMQHHVLRKVIGDARDKYHSMVCLVDSYLHRCSHAHSGCARCERKKKGRKKKGTSKKEKSGIKKTLDLGHFIAQVEQSRSKPALRLAAMSGGHPSARKK